MALAGTEAFAEESPTVGNRTYAACKALARDDYSNRDFAAQGICFGTIRAAIYRGYSFNICAPQGSKHSQSTMIVVNYMEANPQELHKELIDIAISALSKTWPCKS
jgi:hypothetical protein